MPQMNKSKTGRCQHVTGWIQNYEGLDRLYMPKNFPGTDAEGTWVLFGLFFISSNFFEG